MAKMASRIAQIEAQGKALRQEQGEKMESAPAAQTPSSPTATTNWREIWPAITLIAVSICCFLGSALMHYPGFSATMAMFIGFVFWTAREQAEDGTRFNLVRIGEWHGFHFLKVIFMIFWLSALAAAIKIKPFLW